MDIREIRRKVRSKVKPLWPYVQLSALILVSIGAILAGFLMKPPSAHVPNIAAAVPQVTISASLEGVGIYDISSVLQDHGQGFAGFYPTYSMTGKVKVPSGKAASVYIDIFGPGKVTLEGRRWRIRALRDTRFTNGIVVYELERRFSQGTSPFDLNVELDTCNCVTYGSPYLVATTADVQSFAGGPAEGVPPGLPVSGAPWTVTLDFRQSEVNIINDSGIPTALSIVTAFPQAPINVPTSGAWSWPNAAYGSVTAIDLAASESRDMHLFYAGVFLGIAGSAIIGAIQALFTIFGVREERRLKGFELPYPSESALGAPWKPWRKL